MTAVRIERDGPVTTVLLSRPERRNAVDRATAEALADAFREFDGDPSAAVAQLAQRRLPLVSRRVPIDVGDGLHQVLLRDDPQEAVLVHHGNSVAILDTHEPGHLGDGGLRMD